MKKEKTRSIQTLLSTYFLLFSLLLLAITITIISVMQYRSTRDDTIQALQQTSVSIADSVDQQINQMNQISLNAISSSDLMEAFTQYYSDSLSAYERRRQHLHLANALTTAKGFDFAIRQLNVYMPEKGSFGIGEITGDLDQDAPDMEWYQEALDADGRFVVTSKDGYVSLSRMFFNNINVPVGFVEVKKYYNTVFNLAEEPQLGYPVTIAIYDSEGNLLYSASGDGSQSDSRSESSSDGSLSGSDPASFSDTVLSDSHSDSSDDTMSGSHSGNDLFDYYSVSSQGSGSITNTLTGNKEYASFSVSDKNDLVIAVSARQSIFSRQILRSMRWIIPVSLVLLALLLLLSVVVSRRISSPIRHIYHFLADESKDKFQLLEMERTGIREIDKLEDSINENIRSTKAATDTMMTLKEQEVQAQMLALQSQMNPHFLYNSLSTIGEMSQEGLTEQVTRMCDQVTEILRYISSNREQRSTLEEELEICDMYLDCLKMRHGEQLAGTIEVSDDMLDILVPKLCIQLLVENAVRSVTTVAPPWKVDIACRIEDGSWYVTVSDNGPGFDPQVEQELRSQMDRILETGVLPSLKIQGMGILNIFIRLYLLEGIPFIFDLGNREEGGAFVMIGGKLKP